MGINIPVECKCSCSQLYPHQVKEENLKLKSENGVLGQYIENLMQVRTQCAKYCIGLEFKFSKCPSVAVRIVLLRIVELESPLLETSSDLLFVKLVLFTG